MPVEDSGGKVGLLTGEGWREGQLQEREGPTIMNQPVLNIFQIFCICCFLILKTMFSGSYAFIHFTDKEAGDI